MIVGFTGTRLGMSYSQQQTFEAMITHLNPDEFHHGDCLGADADAHEIVREVLPGTIIIGHPPTNKSKRAFCDFDIERPALSYLERDRKIVEQTEKLIATPYGSEKLYSKSGTWYTIRYAKKIGSPVTIIDWKGEVL